MKKEKDSDIYISMIEQTQYRSRMPIRSDSDIPTKHFIIGLRLLDKGLNTYKFRCNGPYLGVIQNCLHIAERKYFEELVDSVIFEVGTNTWIIPKESIQRFKKQMAEALTMDEFQLEEHFSAELRKARTRWGKAENRISTMFA